MPDPQTSPTPHQAEQPARRSMSDVALKLRELSSAGDWIGFDAFIESASRAFAKAGANFGAFLSADAKDAESIFKAAVRNLAPAQTLSRLAAAGALPKGRVATHQTLNAILIQAVEE